MINGTIIGRVGQEPELRTTVALARKVAVFSLAINNRSYTMRNDLVQSRSLERAGRTGDHAVSCIRVIG